MVEAGDDNVLLICDGAISSYWVLLRSVCLEWAGTDFPLQVGRISVDQRIFPEMSEKIVRGHSTLQGVAGVALKFA